VFEQYEDNLDADDSIVCLNCIELKLVSLI